MSVIDSALPQIRQLQPYSPGKPVEELERELGISNAIKLASNENPLGCSPRVTDALARATSQVELYPDANAYYLKQRLAAKLNVGDDQITIGNGSNDVLDIIARSFLDSTTEAIYSQYAFMVYAMVTQACGAQARIAEAFARDAKQPYGHDLDAMLALVGEQTRVIFIANPNNPTGTWLQAEELHHFIEQVPDHIAIVVDEAYFEYVDTDGYPDSLQWLDLFPNLIVTRTFSKIYGIAGLRIGYSISTSDFDLDQCQDLLLGMVIAPEMSGYQFVYDYPVSQATLARVSADDDSVAERFELFFDGLELANGFSELTDVDQQRLRFEQDRRVREHRGLPSHEIDEQLLQALESGLDDCAGVALGLDRLLMVLLELDTIDEVLTFRA